MSGSISSTGEIAARLLSDAAGTRSSTLAPNAATSAVAPDGRSQAIISITISSGAQKGLAAASAGHSAVSAESIAKFGSYFTGREGYSTDALAAAVMNPGAESSSAGKTQAEVGGDARAIMDAKYASMAAAGKPFDPNSDGSDNFALLGEFDRRSLNAIANNVGGLFSKAEQDIARDAMHIQYHLGIGLDDRLPAADRLVWDTFKGDFSAAWGRANHWLDQVSDDEKTSALWAFEKAYAEIGFEQAGPVGTTVVISIARDNAPNLTIASENALVKLIKAAMYEPRERTTSTTIRNLDDLKGQEWMSSYRDQVDVAVRLAKQTYGTSAA